MSCLRHPNIVQFLGVCFSPLPMLVTEKLEGNLRDLLETVQNIPLILKWSLLEDIARGLHYLHTYNPVIIHGDLTARNVLYTSSLTGKIADVCNSQFTITLRDLCQKPDQQPIPAVVLGYMPPNSESNHQQSPTFDVFSFGHLALWTLTQV